MALAAGLVWLFLSGLPTKMFDTPLFTRMTPVRRWDYPFWVAGVALVGLLAATYFPARPEGSQVGKALGGGLLTVFEQVQPIFHRGAKVKVDTADFAFEDTPGF